MCNGDVLTTLDLDALVAFHDARGRRRRSTSPRSPIRRRSGSCRPGTTARWWRSSRSPRRAGPRPTGSTPAPTCSSRRCSTASPSGSRCRSSARPSRACSTSRAASTRCASDAYWIDIGTPEKYLQAHTDVLARRARRLARARCARAHARRVGAGHAGHRRRRPPGGADADRRPRRRRRRRPGRRLGRR